MMLCEGDVVQYNEILSGTVSLYATKLQQFVNVHKSKKKSEPTPNKRPVPKR